ncbi:hypothetical protein FE783_14205 [Paenibacillus mesophilus]|uniref:hypothetical protein n=1 Tax=Paenibacillus mesophilus TaxID=2582849 RepID=UPI00110DFEC4|nr:hypothetical protein [Paenibacillus mesophilus]TMV49643.1 hypothetical protein FE783_14205 [Paenibacillus mesophilus]
MNKNARQHRLPGVLVSGVSVPQSKHLSEGEEARKKSETPAISPGSVCFGLNRNHLVYHLEHHSFPKVISSYRIGGRRSMERFVITDFGMGRHPFCFFLVNGRCSSVWTVSRVL